MWQDRRLAGIGMNPPNWQAHSYNPTFLLGGTGNTCLVEGAMGQLGEGKASNQSELTTESELSSFSGSRPAASHYNQMYSPPDARTHTRSTQE